MTPILEMCMGLGWRVRTRIVTTRIWSKWVKSPVALLLTFIIHQPFFPSTSSNPAPQLVFAYDVDEAVLQAMERGNMHEWTKVEFKAICRKHGLSVNKAKGELMECVSVHFQQLCQL